ncbi:zinc-dependent peptidase [Fulvivirga ulvae]|uniref:M90 family metallopeptidase n=1 Tax=Fulvivirga ulvae TaxID=2904245 RepID=UPI001F3D4DA6|nr:M90 family metallopeptidase [Fulvivirga ulvae]UII33194.1 zinc-dependent peptidase [Fulvivirga ulvae]
MSNHVKPSFFHYFVAIATFLTVAMLSYPLYDHDHTLLAIFIPVALFIAYLVFRSLTRRIRRKAKALQEHFPDTWKELLIKNVKFYRELSPDKKVLFERKVYLFLAEKRITGIDTEVDDLDRLLVASSAVIPIFAFPEWEYNHLDEVLLYPNSFNSNYETAGDDRSISGMVGNGIMNGKMILSKIDLHFGFEHPQHKRNVGIHEFIHLLDESDGNIDGIPDALMEHRYAEPWLRIMHQEMQKIKSNQSDINPYGATSEEEFLPVASEYFFQRPELFKSKHPELYNLLNRIFHQSPKIS